MKNANLPLGTPISWILIIGFSLLVYSVFPTDTLTRTGKKLKILSKALVVISFLWGAISYLLSGNWSWNFNKVSHFYIWVIFTLFLLLTQFTVLCTWAFKRIFKKDI